MSTIVLRSVKGTPLTNTEVDANFSNLNTDKYQSGGALGTPASGTLTNCTGYTYANLTGTIPTWNQNTTGNAATATTAASCSGNAATATTAASCSGNAATATTAASLTTTNFTVVESGGFLYFKHGGVNKMRLDSSGNLVVTGNVTGYGAI
jgi:hypothetical protein